MDEAVSQGKRSFSANHLAREKSPYLLQHATNPVDWYPWGEEAFTKARRENKPIFLSIGYSTCHWCHVMEQESFSQQDVADLLNKYFVSIKVDREERPDVDNLYMKAVMQLTGHGGWPLNVFLTPDLKPFYGGTYFPPEDRWGQPGLKKTVLAVADAWEKRHKEILQSGEDLTQALQKASSANSSRTVSLTKELLQKAFHDLAAQFDEVYGGFSPAPKFPRSHSLLFLLRFWKRSGDAQALQIVTQTLRAMADGGIYDHLAGGFHRYSTDEQWRVPHFEKMLYDQALLSAAYLEAYQATKEAAFAHTAREILDYVLWQMTSPEGGFFSAEDADSVVNPAQPHHKEEGAFYLWKKEEIVHLLGPERAEVFCYLYGIEKNGNALHDPTGELKEKNVFYQAHSLKQAAQKFNRSEKEIEKTVLQSKEILLQARNHRPRPHLDDKILVDWNGLMIASFAMGSRLLDDARYAQAAKKSADFLLEKLVRPDGRLLHRYRDGDAGLLATLDDYAFFIHGLIDLYEATFDLKYLEQAKRLASEMIRLFWDSDKGGFFLVGGDGESLLVRQKELYDGAIPSGNSVAALDLLRLGRLTMESSFEQKAGDLMKSFSADIRQMPTAFPQLLIALDFAVGPSSEIVIVGPSNDENIRYFVRTVDEIFLPNKVMMFHASGQEDASMKKWISLMGHYEMVGGKPTVYVCQNYACQRPVTNTEQLRELLEKPPGE